MELVRLRKEDVKEFKQLMIDAFQCGYESVYGKSEEQILPENDIDNDLNNKNSYAYEMIENNQIVGGVVVTINKETNYNHDGANTFLEFSAGLKFSILFQRTLWI